jgi:hypothetical protein
MASGQKPSRQHPTPSIRNQDVAKINEFRQNGQEETHHRKFAIDVSSELSH